MNYNNPYNPNMGMMDTMNMPSMASMPNSGCGCNMGMNTMPMYGIADGYLNNQMMPQVSSSCNQVLQKCFVEDMPYYVGYNTHVVNNVVRRHIQIPVYSQTQQTVYFDEWQTGCGCNR